MKIITFFLFVATAAFGADRFPEGEYEGAGTKVTVAGVTKPYTVKIWAKENHLKFEYRYPNISPITFDLSLTFDKYGFFTVGSLGSGYCGETSCHYAVNLGDHGNEEWTWFFDGDSVKKVGSLVSAQSKNYWEETLRRVRP